MLFKAMGSVNYASPCISPMLCRVSAVPFNLLIIDSLGRKWTLALDFLGASIFCFLAQICSSHTVYLTITLFGVRSFISGVFSVCYIYTSEVSFQVVLLHTMRCCCSCKVQFAIASSPSHSYAGNKKLSSGGSIHWLLPLPLGTTNIFFGALLHWHCADDILMLGIIYLPILWTSAQPLGSDTA